VKLNLPLPQKKVNRNVSPIKSISSASVDVLIKIICLPSLHSLTITGSSEDENYRQIFFDIKWHFVGIIE